MMKRALIAATSLALILPLGGCGFYPPYREWSAKWSGRAVLAEAVGSRQVKIEEARANFEAAKLNAQAEIERAKGTDAANKIMASSLGGPENYIRWAYIDMLRDTANKDRTIIYLPTEAGVPILEAGRRPPQ